MHQIPTFFYEGPMAEKHIAAMDADASKHIWQVLRMQPGETIQLTDGKGQAAICTLLNTERHKCTAKVDYLATHTRSGGLLHLCVAFTKNNSRNEWMLEKATELGAASIIPLATQRAEKMHVRSERWLKILQSALLQSQQYHLPVLTEQMRLDEVVKRYSDVRQKLLAHCIDTIAREPIAQQLKPSAETVLLIGPEGDFTEDEVHLCLNNGFTGVSIGNQRLRTETAAIATVAYYNTISYAH